MKIITECWDNQQTLTEGKYTREFLRGLAKSNPSASQTLIKNGALTKGSPLRNHFAKQLKASNNGGFGGVQKLRDSIRTNDRLLAVSSPAERQQLLADLKQQRQTLSNYRKLGAADMNGTRFVPTRSIDTYNRAAQNFANKFAGGKYLERNVTVAPNSISNELRKAVGMKPKTVQRKIISRSASRLPKDFNIPDVASPQRLSTLPRYTF